MIVEEAIRILALTLIAFVIALTATPWVLKLLKKFNIRKQIRTSESAPIFSSLHKGKEGTPTMGGVIIWGTVLFLAIIFFLFDVFSNGGFGNFNFINRAETYLPLTALALAALIGLVDDVAGVLKIGPKGGGLTMSGKILVYILLSALGAWWFYFKLEWTELYIPFIGGFDVGAWYIPIFMFVIVASAFSANETDGLDGLLGGVSLFAFGALTVVAFTLERFDLAAMGGVILGALLAFLWFNIYPAKFFMGDTGSMALGITLGVMAMLTNTMVLLPLFFAIPVIESASVIVQTISKKVRKKKIFLSTPIHHHFEAIGWPESQITMRFWIISVIATGLGLVIFFIDRLM